jgi:acetyl/propionyl-CoA carboxylase alpha subunit
LKKRLLRFNLRKKNGRSSRFSVKSCDYLAGTVEFYWTKIIISTLGDEYAFASGTSVTEWIAGTLVELQIRVARGKNNQARRFEKIKDMRWNCVC